jgi:hypothetical protein
VVEGSGEEVSADDRVMVAYAYFNGETGDKIGHIGYDEMGPDMIPADPEAPYLIGLVHTLLCSQVGDRVAGVIPAEEAFGAAGAPEYGLGEGVSIIFIADILGIQPPPEPPLEQLVGDQKHPPGRRGANDVCRGHADRWRGHDGVRRSRSGRALPRGELEHR